MNANLTFSGVPLAYRSRSLGEGSSQPRDTDLGEVDLGSLTRLHLAVAELFNAVSSALQEQWDTAQESVQRASAILKIVMIARMRRYMIPVASVMPACACRAVAGSLFACRARTTVVAVDE